jgi:tetratricopeptide (TPR) repeat protein
LSSKKDKLLESAQKFIAKGQFDRAIKDYEQIVSLDPGDTRQRQRLAELLVRGNRKEDAIAVYEAIGKQYSDNVFYLKAIAVYKQVQKLDPANIKTTLTLASLNEKQGLIGNALAEYNQAVTYYQKTGELPEAIKVIEKMLAADPENLNTQLKFAETYFAAGLADKACREFTRLALLLQKRGDESAFSRVCERVLGLYPDKKDFVLDLLITQVEEGEAAAVIPLLEKTLAGDNSNLQAWKLLVDAYLQTGEIERRKSTLQKIIKLFPDESAVVESLVQIALDEGDIAGTLDLLKAHEAHFNGHGALPFLERCYASLREMAPDDVGILQGLKHAYEAAGETNKLALLVADMDSPRQTAELPAAEPEEPYLEANSVIPEASLPAEPKETVQEMAWEEEVDLSLLEEQGMSEPEEERAEQADIFHEEEPLFESADLTEVDLEIETTDVLDNEWLQDIDKVEPLAARGMGNPSLGEKQGKHDSGSQFIEFKKGIDSQLDKEDAESHYDLGIAYKEMGLFDDAIAEFQAAAFNPRRKIDCLTLEGICYRDRGDFNRAEEVFISARLQTGLSDEELLSLNYELAFLYETVGRSDEALHLYRQVRAADSVFRDAAQRIRLLSGGDALHEHDELELLELEVEEFD